MADREPDFRQGRLPTFGRSAMVEADGSTGGRLAVIGAALGVALAVLASLPVLKLVGVALTALCVRSLVVAGRSRRRARGLSRRVAQREAQRRDRSG